MDQLSTLRNRIHEAYAHNNMDLAFQLEEIYEDLFSEQRQINYNNQKNMTPRAAY